MVSAHQFEEEAERCLLGSILLKPDILSDIEHVKPSDFGTFAHQAIFATICELADEDSAIDAVTVGQCLIDGPQSRELGGADKISEQIKHCLDSVSHPGHADHHARQVSEHSRRRQITKIGRELADSVQSGADVLTILSERLPALTELVGASRRETMALNTRCLADIEARPLEWLWPALLPLGKLSLFCGDPGLGKSFVTCDLAARVSRGAKWPNSDDEQPAGTVLILACEDDAEDTIRPRLDAAGADVRRIHIIDSVSIRKKERGFSLDADVPLLNREIERLGDVRLLIIDPISAYCGQVDTHRNSEVRTMLRPLTDLAAHHRFAIVGINHLTKGGGKAVYRGMGSIAFNAAARAVLNFGKDPDDEDRRLVLTAKANLIPEPVGLAYRIEDGAVVWDDEPVDISADELEQLQAATGSPAKGEQRKKAKEFLYVALATGERTFDDLFVTGKASGISRTTLRRAMKDTGCKRRKDGMTGPVYWRLPDGEETTL